MKTLREAYVEGTLSVPKKRIFTTKWVADAWEKIKKQPHITKHSFLKCELSNNLDGTEDDQIMPSAERELNLLDDDEESGGESKFAEVDIDYSNDLIEPDSELESD